MSFLMFFFIVNIAACNARVFTVSEEAESSSRLSIRVDFLLIKSVLFSQKEQDVIKVP